MRPAATLTLVSTSRLVVRYKLCMTNLAAADHKNQLVADLPGEHQRAAALDFWKLGHGNKGDGSVLELRSVSNGKIQDYIWRLAIRKAHPAAKLIGGGIASWRPSNTTQPTRGPCNGSRAPKGGEVKTQTVNNTAWPATVGRVPLVYHGIAKVLRRRPSPGQRPLAVARRHPPAPAPTHAFRELPVACIKLRHVHHRDRRHRIQSRPRV